jgi:hypothetical protein
MIIIEAVRTRCWQAIAGQHQVMTVDTCAEELRRGDLAAPGYVVVSADDLKRVGIESLPALAAARFRLQYPNADGMDDGERDLLALATTRQDDFRLCSCDKAAVLASHAMGWIDRLVSLESLAESVGARPHPPLRVQFTEARLSEWRTKVQLGVRL